MPYHVALASAACQAIQPLPIGPNCQISPDSAMPKWALAWACRSLNQLTALGSSETIVCIRTPAMIPLPKVPLAHGHGELYLMSAGPVTRPDAVSMLNLPVIATPLSPHGARHGCLGRCASARDGGAS